jgi:hypothetical protein
MSSQPHETQIPLGALVAAIGGVLLIVSLGLDWYGGISGFNSFEFLDLLLVLLALVTFVGLAIALGVLRTSLWSGTELVVGGSAFVVVLSQWINHPPIGLERDVKTGLWLGLGGAALMFAGAVLSTARIAIAVEPRERRAAPAPRQASADKGPTVADEPPSRP